MKSRCSLFVTVRLMFPSHILLVFFFLTCFSAFAQHQQLDSLKALLPRVSDREASQVYLNLAYETMETDPKASITYSKKLFNLASKFGDSLRMVKAIRMQAFSLRQLEKIDSSNLLSLQILPLARRLGQGREFTLLLNGLATGFMGTCQYDQSLTFSLETYDNALKQNEEDLVIASLNNMGLLYYKLHDYDKAIELFRKAEGPNNAYSVIVNLNLILLNTRKHNFNEAASYLERVRQLLPQISNRSWFDYYFNLGLYYQEQALWDSAQVNYEKAFKLGVESNSKQRSNISAINLASVMGAKGNFSSQLKYLKAAESSISQTAFNSEKIDTYQALAEFYTKLGDVYRAAFYLKKYVGLKDSLFTETRLNNLVRIEKDFLEKKKNIEILEQKENVHRKDAIIQRNYFVIALAIAIASLLTCITLLLLKGYRQKQNFNRILEEKIKERTNELLAKESLLYRQSTDQSKALEKTKAEMTNKMATIEGLCRTALSDEVLCATAKDYLTRISNLVSN